MPPHQRVSETLGGVTKTTTWAGCPSFHEDCAKNGQGFVLGVRRPAPTPNRALTPINISKPILADMDDIDIGQDSFRAFLRLHPTRPKRGAPRVWQYVQGSPWSLNCSLARPEALQILHEASIAHQIPLNIIDTSCENTILP